MKHNNRQGDLHCHGDYQGELQYHLSQHAAMPSYRSVCICLVDISYPTYFPINLAFICFILPLQISLTVLQCCHVPGCRLLNYSARATCFPGSVEICCLFSPSRCLRPTMAGNPWWSRLGQMISVLRSVRWTRRVWSAHVSTGETISASLALVRDRLREGGG